MLREFGVLDHGVYRDRLMKLAARTSAMKYHSMRMLTDRLKKRPPAARGADHEAQRLPAEPRHRQARDRRDAGDRARSSAARATCAPTARWQIGYMFPLGLIIGGGTAQIQKNIISERGLGMPRGSRKARRSRPRPR